MLELYAIKQNGMYLSMVTATGWSEELTIDCLYSDRNKAEEYISRFPRSELITLSVDEVIRAR